MISIDRQRALFAHNGFQVFRGVVPNQEATTLARFLRLAYGVNGFDLFTRTDIANKIPEARPYITDDRITAAVRASVGGDIGFTQQSDFHANYNAHGWHRDAANRTYGLGGDWDESTDRFAVVKAILYLESENFALCMMPRSHRVNVLPDANWQDFSRYDVLPLGNVLDVALYEDGNVRPVLVEVEPGDVLVFDVRIFHGGRLLDPKFARFHMDQSHAKTALAMVYGLDNVHSERFYSYSRFIRTDMEYGDLPASFIDHLRDQNLLLSHYGENLFEKDPEQLTGIVGPNTNRQTAQA